MILRRVMGFTPSPENEEILRCMARVILISGGERAGKSYTAAMFLGTRMWQGKLFWLVGSDYRQCDPEFRYMVEALNKAGVLDKGDVRMPDKGPWRLRAEGIRIESKSAVDIRKLGGEAPDGIIMCEAAQMDYDVYTKCLGRTAEKRGWLLLVGTLESGADWYAQSLDEWQGPNAEDAKSFVLPSWSNRTLYPLGREDPEIKRQEKLLPHDEFMMRFGATAQPPRGLCLPEFQFKIHVPGDIRFEEWEDEEAERRWPVELWIDPGYSGSYYSVEAVQIAEADHHYEGPHVHVIDEVYVQGAYTPMVIEECRGREWWPNVTRVTIDVAGTQHHAAPSHAEVWASEGVGVVWQKVPIEDGILRHRTFLKDPGTEQARIFYSEECKGAFREYRKWVRREVTGLRNQTAAPQKVNCDAMKAVNYGLIANFGFVEYDGPPAKIESPLSF
jgi:hypothetical protein